MKEQNEEKNLEVSDVITRTGAYIEKNKKTLTIIVAAVIVVAVGIWAYIHFYAGPREVQASEEMYAAEQWFGDGDYEKALNGNEQYLGFAQMIDEYGSTKAGNLAHYYAGICQLNLGKYDEAIDLLKGYKGKDTFTGAEATMLMGDAYAELKDYEEAAGCYEKAAKMADNFVTAPTALWKAGMCYLAMDNSKDAVRCFKVIKDKYNESTEWSEVDKYIAYAEGKE